MNGRIAEFLANIEARYPSDSSTMPTSRWIELNTKLKKKPFSFEGFGFQVQIANDLHPNLSCMKPSQIGLSEIQIRKFLAFLKRTTAVTGIYTMPTDIMRDRFSQTRVRPIVDSEAVFNGPLVDSPVRHKGLVQIDHSFGYLTGSTEGDATSIPADMLMHDEYDLSDQRLMGLFQSRLQASAYKITQRYSTPTYTGYGIDSAVKASDLHEYVCKCDHCNHWQIPDWTPTFLKLPGLSMDVEDLIELTDEQIDDIDFDGCFIRCEKCSRPLCIGSTELREWVPEFPTRKTRGYRVRPFCVDFITPAYIFAQLRERRRLGDIKGFVNTVLGQPYNDGDARLSEDDIRGCFGSPAEQTARDDEPVFVGIDAGLTYHVVVGTPSRVLGFYQVPHTQIKDFVEGLFKAHQITAGCGDRHPYTPTAEEIRDLDGHKFCIMPVVYSTHGDAPSVSPVKDEFGELSHYSANRTRMLDVVAKVIRKRQIELNGYGDHATLLVTQLRDMVRIEAPEVPPKWQKLSGNDHWFHALGYMLLSMRMLDLSVFKSDQDLRSTYFLYGKTILKDGASTLHPRRDSALSKDFQPLALRGDSFGPLST